MTKLKTTNIKGKEYVEVNTRIEYFRSAEEYKGWTLDSEIISMTDDRIVMKGLVLNPEGRLIASGTAYETANSSFINKTSYIENCETSAWGRALGNLGIGIDGSVASYEEVANAIENQNKKPKSDIGAKATDKKVDDFIKWGKDNGKTADEVISTMLGKLILNDEQKDRINKAF